MAVLLAIFFLCLVGLPVGTFPQGFILAATWGAGVLLVAVLCFLLLAPRFQRLAMRLGRHRWLNAALMQPVANLVEVLALVCSLPGMLMLIGLSAVAWVCEGIVFVVIALAFNAGTALLAPWFSLAAGTLATALPSAPGYIGTFHYFAAKGLAAYGTSAETAAVFALTVHAIPWVSSTAVGLLCLFLHGVPLRKGFQLLSNGRRQIDP